MRITNAGNVGIGTTAPDKELQIISSGSSHGIEVANKSGNGRYELSLAIDSSGTGLIDTYHVGTGPSNLGLVPNGGKVGIGTTSPDYKLHVYGTSGWLAAVGDLDSAGYNVRLSPNAIGAYNVGSSSSLSINPDGGNVGIGTINPGSKLDVDGNIGVIYSSSSRSIGFTPTDTFTPAGGDVTARYGLTRESFGANTVALSGYSGLGFFTTDAQRLTIDSSGQVGINTASPSALLTINSPNNNGLLIQSNSGTNSPAIFFHNSSGTQTAFIGSVYSAGSYGTSTSVNDLSIAAQYGGGIYLGTDSGGGNPAVGLYVKNGGNVGIGTTSPNAKLSVGGSGSGITTSAYIVNTDNSTYDGSAGLYVNRSTSYIDDVGYGLNEKFYAIVGNISGSFTAPFGSTLIVGVYGDASKVSGGGIGVYGKGSTGVSASGSSTGVYGFTSSNSGYGVQGYGGKYGVYGVTTTANAYSIYGYAIGTNSVGVSGTGSLADFNALSGKYYLNSTPPASVGSSQLCWDGSGVSYIGQCTSLRQYKKDIQPLNFSLSDYMKLNPVSFYWKNNGSSQNIQGGFIAEDVAKINPILAEYNWNQTLNNSALIGVNFEAITALNTKIIQEQQKTIDAQNETINNQSEMIKGLNDTVNALNQTIQNICTNNGLKC